MRTGISDVALLRALAEDVPDMALEVREQLRDIAAYLADEVYDPSDAAKAECASTNPTMSIPVRRESPAPSASDPMRHKTWNDAMERAAQMADAYAKLYKSQAAARIAEDCRACRLPLPSPSDLGLPERSDAQ